MEIEAAIVDAGTEGVLRYREISNAAHDNPVPKSSLADLSHRLHDRFRHPVHVERPYIPLAAECGVTLPSVELLTAFGG
jgi:hypothetical protein